jgi:hypothetical protein
MMPSMRTYTLAVLLLAVGCGKDPAIGGDDMPPTDADNGSGSADAYVPPTGYTKLIGRTWSIPAGGKDIYKCVRVTIPTDMYVTDILAQAPVGTHHTVLSIAAGNAAGADGEQDCSVGTIGRPMLYASGVGTDPFAFPTDVSVKIAAGTQIHLNLHLYNAGDDALAAESAIWVKSQSTPTPTLAEMVFAGKIAFSFTGAGTHTVTGGCAANQDFNLFAVWPHMHKIATHSKFEITRTGVAQPFVLWDAPYDFNDQKYYPPNGAAEFQVKQGDQIKVTCTYDSPGGTITFGDSSDKEMCFTGMYRYPSQNASVTQCTDFASGIPGG